MDRELIAEKLESLRRCVARIEAKCPATVALLVADPDVQDIVAINLQRAIQLCVDIGAHLIAESEAPAPVTMGETFEGLVAANVIPAALGERLRKAVGLRNIAVHSYAAIDWAIVHAVCTTRLPDFSEFAHAISSRLSR